MHATRTRVVSLGQRLSLAMRSLNAVSPLATLDRGYAIITYGEQQQILLDAAAVTSGTTIQARLARGAVTATVTAKTRGTQG